MQHKFDFTKGPGLVGTLDFGPKIDWTANPTMGEAKTHLWNESLNWIAGPRNEVVNRNLNSFGHLVGFDGRVGEVFLQHLPGR